jgi:hypothetical protein
MKSWLRSDDLIDVEQLFVVHFSNSILHCGINWDSSVLLFLLLPASSRHRFCYAEIVTLLRTFRWKFRLSFFFIDFPR